MLKIRPAGSSNSLTCFTNGRSVCSMLRVLISRVAGSTESSISMADNKLRVVNPSWKGLLHPFLAVDNFFLAATVLLSLLMHSKCFICLPVNVSLL